MSENTKSTPKEIPLHEVVLKLMFEANKEKPARVDTNDIFWKISDAAVSERHVTEVLKWLVSQRRAEYEAGKYSLDRFEFLDQRKKDEAGKGASKGKASKSPKEEIALHDIVLQLMFDADREKPAELSVNDLFWKISDPSVHESQVGDVLKWLLHHRRVEFKAGKYSLDRFEFLDQTKESESAAPVKKPSKAKEEPKVAKAPKPEAKKPKIIIPSAPDETTVSSARKPKPKPKEPKKVEKAPEARKKVSAKKPVKPSQPVATPKPKEEAVPLEREDDNMISAILLGVAACVFAYTLYLIISLSTSPSVQSEKAQDEVAKSRIELKKLSEIPLTASNKIEVTEKRLDLIQDITLKNDNSASVKSLQSTTKKLFLSNGIILIIFGIVLYRSRKFRAKRN